MGSGSATRAMSTQRATGEHQLQHFQNLPRRGNHLDAQFKITKLFAARRGRSVAIAHAAGYKASDVMSETEWQNPNVKLQRQASSHQNVKCGVAF
eukprot:5761563-Pyramimonas_sp.AAC.1